MTKLPDDQYIAPPRSRWAPRSLFIVAGVLAASDILDVVGRWSPWRLIASLYLGSYIPFITVPLIVVLVIGAAIARFANPPADRFTTLGTVSVAVGWFAVGTYFYSIAHFN